LLWNLHKPCSPGYKSKRTPARKQLFVKSSPVNPWHGMFGIFPRWLITHHDSMQCFSNFFNFFLNSLSPPSRSRSNSRCLRCVPDGLGTMVWCWF
jgi:hypothetical protein